MNKDIDYDELDQAVTSAMVSSTDEPTPEEPQKTAAHDGPLSPKPTPAAEAVTIRRPVKPRGLYMDMVSRKSPMRPIPKPHIPKPAPTKIEHDTEFGVIEDSPVVDETITTDFIAEPTPLEPKVLTTPRPLDPAPNPENYALGGRSPFIENAIIEKRPLGDDVPDSNSRSIRSTKNVYSERLATSRTPVESPLEHEIVPDKRTSGFARFILVLLVIAIGAGIGIVAWYLINSGIISL